MKYDSQVNRIPSLDGIRAIAIILVLFGHGASTININKSPIIEAILGFVFPYLGNAHLGVATFFVMSSYLITYLLRQEIEKHGNIDVRGFYLRRFLRIFPAFYAYLGFICLLVFSGILTIPPVNLAAAGTFVWNYAHLWSDTRGQDIWFIGHLWTLSLEQQFYLFWPLILVCCGRKKSFWLATILIVLSPVLRVGSYFLFPNMRDQIPIMMHTNLDAFMFGSAIALIEGSIKFECIFQKVCRGKTVIFAALFLLFISPLLIKQFKGLYLLPIGSSLEGIALIFVMMWLVRNANTAVGKFFNSKLLVYLGVLSYSLYLWQQLFLTRLNTTWLGLFPLNLLCCYIAAEISYRCVEKPFWKFRKLLKRKESTI